MKLRKLTNKDISKILLLEKNHAPNEPYYSKYSLSDLDYLFNNHKHCTAYGLFDNQKLIGWGSYRTNWHRHKNEKNTFEISSIVIDKKYRRKGLGGKLLKRLLFDWNKTNHNKAFLTVSPYNQEALQLYLKNGFVIYKKKESVYEAEGSNRLYLSLNKKVK